MDTNKVYATSFNVAYRENAGEDAPPICLISEDKQYGALAVFDGLGGAGSAIRECEDGSSATDAYLASRLVRNSVLAYLNAHQTNHGYEVDKDELTAYLKHELDTYRDYLDIEPSRLHSSMSKVLPTTMSMLLWHIDNDTVHITNLWAGDSRNYMLNHEGLAQLTTDHTREPLDAMQSIHHDPPMNNCICQSQPFYIEQSSYSTSEPVILYACTDGCFNYYDSPMSVEHEFCNALSNQGIECTKDNMVRSIQAVAADDFSCAMVMIGLPQEAWYREVKQSHKAASRILHRYWMYQQIQNLIPLRMQQAWEEYKSNYERVIHHRD